MKKLIAINMAALIGPGSVYAPVDAEDLDRELFLDSEQTVSDDLVEEFDRAPKNVKADSITGAIEVSWDMGEENDITDYILFRSTDGENFEELTGGLYSLNYWDRDVEKETKYRYRVQVRDRAGNISEASQIVDCKDWRLVLIIFHIR